MNDLQRRAKASNMTLCAGYCGAACIDGSCPNALRDENPEYYEDCYGTLNPQKCSECAYNKGCEDCCVAYYSGQTEEECRKDHRLK